MITLTSRGMLECFGMLVAHLDYLNAVQIVQLHVSRMTSLVRSPKFFRAVCRLHSSSYLYLYENDCLL